MFCHQCGTPGTGPFCSICGTKLVTGNAALQPEHPKETHVTPSKRLINKKICNALIEKAEVSHVAKFLLSKVHGDLAINALKQLSGGLWVGGNAFLYGDALEFKPNMLNKLIHSENVSWRIPLADIIEVKSSFGIVTRIINIRTENVMFKIRCYGADSFADQIDKQVKTLRGVRED